MLETALLNFTSFVMQGSSLPAINKIGKEGLDVISFHYDMYLLQD